MKLFRFRLRLLFLVVALVSVLLAWQRAERELKRHEHEFAIIQLHERLCELRAQRREQLLKANTFNRFHQLRWLSSVRRTEREIDATQMKLDSLALWSE